MLTGILKTISTLWWAAPGGKLSVWAEPTDENGVGTGKVVEFVVRNYSTANGYPRGPSSILAQLPNVDCKPAIDLFPLTIHRTADFHHAHPRGNPLLHHSQRLQ